MPSAAYDKALAEAQAHHARSKTYSGKFLRPHKPVLLALIAEHGVGSALDYGCGKGAQYDWIDPADGQTLEAAFGFEVAKYDPAWAPFAREPEGVFDLVLCTHTLGAIPTADQDWAIDRIYGLAAKLVYIAEKLGPTKKQVFSDPAGFPQDWSRDRWLSAISPHARAGARRGIATVTSFRVRDEDGGPLVERLAWVGGGRSIATNWRTMPVVD